MPREHRSLEGCDDMLITFDVNDCCVIVLGKKLESARFFKGGFDIGGRSGGC